MARLCLTEIITLQLAYRTEQLSLKRFFFKKKTNVFVTRLGLTEIRTLQLAYRAEQLSLKRFFFKRRQTFFGKIMFDGNKNVTVGIQSRTIVTKTLLL